MPERQKTIIVSNRLPIKIGKGSGKDRSYKNSEGGLATGLGSIYQEGDNVWVGWPGTFVRNAAERSQIQKDFRSRNLFPVFLSQEEIEGYYDGFSNDMLWPLFHYFPSYAHYDLHYWEAYWAVNQKFAQAVLSIAGPDDIIWIHDYQLLLLPAMLRDAMPQATIGFFQHIPFPSYEVFRLIPWREQLLKGMLGADLIGFHTYDDVRHFMSAATRIVPIVALTNEIVLEDRRVTADAFPMGIDYKKYSQQAPTSRKEWSKHQLQRLKGDKKLIVSVDRLDYSKGIPQRLAAIDRFLTKYPVFRERVVFFQLVVPSRDQVKQYAELKEEIDRWVAEINARHGTFSWQPIQYFYRAFSLEMLGSLYAQADAALVTSLRDGMNLVCKEYIASRSRSDGVLILSEMAGASKELYEAISINPTDKEGMADAMHQALGMDAGEQIRRMTAMQQVVMRFNIHHWVETFIDTLHEVKQKLQLLNTRKLTKEIEGHQQTAYRKARSRLLFLDYDGTLVPFQTDPLAAYPDPELLALLERLCSDPANRLVIISGRKKDTLDNWLQGLALDIIAEHGAWLKRQDEDWRPAHGLTNEWKDVFAPLLKKYELRTPGTFIEEKSFSLAWHYRKTEKGLGELRARELVEDLKYRAATMGLQILEGNKVLEVKSMHINKGNAAKEWLKRYPRTEFVCAIGDDQTDEDTFKAMPKRAITIKVGQGISAATYFLKNAFEARRYLAGLAGAGAGNHPMSKGQGL